MPKPGGTTGSLYVFAGLDLDGGQEPWGVTVDMTPPVITPQITGTLASSGAYTSDVTVHFDVTDPESAVAPEGCGDVTVSTDTPGLTLRCVADSAGGTSEVSVTLRRDATAPTLTCPASALFSQGALALEVRVSDSQDPSPGLTYEPALAEVTPLSESVHVVARDASGNISSCEVPVQVPGAPPRQDPASPSRWGCSTVESSPGWWAVLAGVLVALRRRRPTAA